MALNTRPPTGKPSWPFVLVEGPEKCGKSWLAAELAASPRIGTTVWFDLGEGSADEYLDPADPRHQVVLHDGTFASLLAAAVDAKQQAAQDLAAGRPPLLFVLDSATLEWELLSSIADAKARDRINKRAANGRGRAIADDDKPSISVDLWNEVRAKHRKLVTVLMTFPGVVVVTARGKETAQMGEDGRPVEGRRVYKVEAEKNLAYDASVHIRLSRDEPPTVIGVRSKRVGLRPGVDKPKQVPDLALDRFIFDTLGLSAVTAQARDLVQPQATAADLADPTPLVAPVSGPPQTDRSLALSRLFVLLADADLNDRDRGLQFINEKIAPASVASTKELTPEQVDLVVAALERFIAQQEPAAPAAEPAPTQEEMPVERPVASQKAHRRMHALWGQLGYTTARRDERMELTRQIIRREITTSAELTPDEVQGVIEVLERRVQQQQEPPAQEAAPEPVRSGPITVPQRRRITDLLNAQGADTAAAMLPLINAALHPVSVRSLRALTEAQADQVIAHLTRQAVPA